MVSPSSLLQLISGASNRLMLNLNRKWSASSSWGMSQKEVGSIGGIASQPAWWHHFSKRTCLWQVNWNHHWCYLFSNAPRLTGDILFGVYPKGELGAQRFAAPSRSDSRSVLTPKQRDSLETCSGICHNPAPSKENTNSLNSLFTLISLSVLMLVSYSSNLSSKWGRNCFPKKQFQIWLFSKDVIDVGQNIPQKHSTLQYVCCYFFMSSNQEILNNGHWYILLA